MSLNFADLSTLKEISKEEVAKHNTAQDCWMIIDGLVFDVTKFLPVHPAGKKILLQYAGLDATSVFSYFHDADSVRFKYRKLIIGKTPEGPKKVTYPLKEFPNTDPEGSCIPYGDPADLQGWFNPFMNETHKQLRKNVRKWTLENLEPYTTEWEEAGKVPDELYKKVAEQGFFALAMGKGLALGTKYYPSRTVCGVEIENEDSFHEYIVLDQVNRIASGGVSGFFWAGICIGLPPVIMFANDYLKDKVVGPCLRGEKRICLAITEPWGGSDVANLQTTAKLSEDGKYYIVNGMKKWISNGIFSDFLTVAVRTGEEGMFGISLLLMEKTMPGVQMRKMKCMGGWTSGTTFISFENVKVPVENLIGEEGEGFKYIMLNFNHERLMICMGGVCVARICYEEAFKFAHQRKTFGKTLIEHPVIRLKLAHMVRQIEGCQALLEQCLYNYDRMDQQQKLALLPGTLGILKGQMGQTFDYCAREAIQIFGGLGYTRGGKGGKVERLYREVKGFIIIGGSEEIMLDLGMKMASRLMPNL